MPRSVGGTSYPSSVSSIHGDDNPQVSKSSDPDKLSGEDGSGAELRERLLGLEKTISEQSRLIERLQSAQAKASEPGANTSGAGKGVYKSTSVTLEEKYFRRLSKFAGDKAKWKSWMFSFTTMLGMVDRKLAHEVIRLMVRESNNKADPEKYEVEKDSLLDESVKHYGMELFGLLVELMEEESEPHGMLIGMQEKAMAKAESGELELGYDGFKALVILQRRYDVRTGSGMLRAFAQVVSPSAIKSDKDLIMSIRQWEQRLVALQTRYKEVISERMKTALMVNMLPKRV